jgi:hypothetical protein
LEMHERASTAIFNENAAEMGKVLIETLKNLLTRTTDPCNIATRP